jgi:hypothetical protein
MAIPSMKVRCMKKNRMMTGETTSVEAAVHVFILGSGIMTRQPHRTSFIHTMT